VLTRDEEQASRQFAWQNWKHVRDYTAGDTMVAAGAVTEVPGTVHNEAAGRT